MKKRNKGFTLIELLVTIAVIAVLVLLAAPRLLGYTDKAKVSELTTNTRAIQDASERYYLDHDETEWPRLTDTPYTDDEVKTFAEKIYDITGKEVNLDEDGKYYDIDFDKLKPYIDVPGEKTNYILQNPVGKVYSLYKPTQEALKRLSENAENAQQPGYTEEQISELIIQGYVPIANAEELQKLYINSHAYRTFGEGTKWKKEYVGDLSSKFIQVKDIDLSELNFIPIGKENIRFNGEYDGGNFNIKNLNINRITTENVGLFGYTEEAIIKNVNLLNSHVEGKNSVGSLAGRIEKTVVKNVFSNNYFTKGEDWIGGLIGFSNISSIVDNSFSNGKAEGLEQVGGLVGRLEGKSEITKSKSSSTIISIGTSGGLVGLSFHSSLINQSFSNSEVKSTNGIAGGLIGWNYNSTVEDSFSLGSVEGKNRVGGLVGRNYSSSAFQKGTVKNSYSISFVNTTTINKGGGLIGIDEGNSEGIIENSYYSLEESNQSDTGKGTGLTSEQMKTEASYKNWDFENIWEITPGNYPQLKNN